MFFMQQVIYVSSLGKSDKMPCKLYVNVERYRIFMALLLKLRRKLSRNQNITLEKYGKTIGIKIRIISA